MNDKEEDYKNLIDLISNDENKMKNKKEKKKKEKIKKNISSLLSLQT